MATKEPGCACYTCANHEPEVEILRTQAGRLAELVKTGFYEGAAFGFQNYHTRDGAWDASKTKSALDGSNNLSTQVEGGDNDTHIS